MVFIETPVFTRQVQELLSDEAYSAFQWYMALNPQAMLTDLQIYRAHGCRFSDEEQGK